jgi:hypothetical protein
MLEDPKWTQGYPPPMSLIDRMIEWCEKKPRKETYNFADFELCACGQFARSIGATDEWKWSILGIYDPSRPIDKECRLEWHKLNNIAAAMRSDLLLIRTNEVWSFGALYDRLIDAKFKNLMAAPAVYIEA